MKTRLLLLLLLCGLLAQAQNIEVSGLQSGIWEADTVFVTGDVSIQDSLIIRPGTTVLFSGFYGIDVHGGASLKAVGTETDSITFTVADTTGFHRFNLGRGGWNGIRLDKAGSVRLDYCRLQYGKAALDDDQDGGALRIFNCDDVEIGNSTLRCNFSREHGGALNAVLSNIVMHDCQVIGNKTYTQLDTVYFMYGGGLRFLKCEVELTGMDFRENRGEMSIGGALCLDSCSVAIDRSVFEDNYGINGGGLYLLRSFDKPCSITNSLFDHNTSAHFGGGLAISDSSPEVSNLTVAHNHSVGVSCSGIFFYQQSSPIVSNCIIYGNVCDSQLMDDVQIWLWTFDDYVPEFHNCLIEHGLEGITNYEIVQVYENNMDDDPLFVDAESRDYRLSGNSPCINAGLTQAEDYLRLDLGGIERVKGGTIDLGAYEYSGTGLHEAAQAAGRMAIAGNPITAASQAEFELERDCDVMATVYSLDGKALVGKRFGGCRAGLNRVGIGELFASLPAGGYVLVIEVSGKVLAAKAIVP